MPPKIDGSPAQQAGLNGRVGADVRLGLVYGGFTYTSRTRRANIGPIELAVAEKNTVNVPIWAGIGSIAVGGGMLFIGKKGKSV